MTLTNTSPKVSGTTVSVYESYLTEGSDYEGATAETVTSKISGTGTFTVNLFSDTGSINLFYADNSGTPSVGETGIVLTITYDDGTYTISATYYDVTSRQDWTDNGEEKTAFSSTASTYIGSATSSDMGGEVDLTSLGMTIQVDGVTVTITSVTLAEGLFTFTYSYELTETVENSSLFENYADGTSAEEYLKCRLNIEAEDNIGDNHGESNLWFRVWDDEPTVTVTTDTTNTVTVDYNADGAYDAANLIETTWEEAATDSEGEKITGTITFTYTNADGSTTTVTSLEEVTTKGVWTFTLTSADGDELTFELTCAVTAVDTNGEPTEYEYVCESITWTYTYSTTNDSGETIKVSATTIDLGNLSEHSSAENITGTYVDSDGTTHVFTLSLDDGTYDYTTMAATKTDVSSDTLTVVTTASSSAYISSETTSTGFLGALVVYTTTTEAVDGTDDDGNATSTVTYTDAILWTSTEAEYDEDGNVTGYVTTYDLSGMEDGDTWTGSVTVTETVTDDDGSETTVTTTTDYTVTYINGSYVFDIAEGTATVYVIAADYDGDTDVAELTLTAPVVSDAEIIVDEALLDGGNADNADGHAVSGEGTLVVDLNGRDGTITIGDSVTLAVTDGAAYTLSGDEAYSLTVNGVTITVTGVTQSADTGLWTITYSYELTAAQDHEEGSDTLTATVTVTALDASGDSSSGVITVTIHDDSPQAYDNSATLEEAIGTVSGNVLTDAGTGTTDDSDASSTDSAGADGLASLTWGVTTSDEDTSPYSLSLTSTSTDEETGVTTHTYTVCYTVDGSSESLGTLTLASDGSYTLTLLDTFDVPQSGLEDLALSYTITDTDNDTSAATLTITLAADSNVPTVSASAISVDEAYLNLVDSEGNVTARGSAYTGADTDSGYTSGSGTFTFCLNGEDGEAILSYGGAAITISVADGTAGYTSASDTTLRVNGVDVTFGDITATTGTDGVTTFTVSYTYVLTASAEHGEDGSETDDTLEDAITITVTDATGDTATGTVTVVVADDTPALSAKDDRSGGLEGTLGTAGADVSVAAVVWESVTDEDTGAVTASIRFINSDEEEVTPVVASTGEELTTFTVESSTGDIIASTDDGTVVLRIHADISADGTVSYTATTSEVLNYTQTTTYTLDSTSWPSGNSSQLAWVKDSSGAYAANLTTTDAEADGVLLVITASQKINLNKNGWGLKNSSSISSGETITFDFNDSLAVTSFTIGFSATASFTYVITYTDGSTESVTEAVSTDSDSQYESQGFSYLYTFSTEKAIDSVTLTFVADTGIMGFLASSSTTYSETGDISASVGFTITDGDGDTVDGDLSIDLSQSSETTLDSAATSDDAAATTSLELDEDGLAEVSGLLGIDGDSDTAAIMSALSGLSGDDLDSFLTGLEALDAAGTYTADDGSALILGGDGADTLAGGGGDDMLFGLAGDDTLDGGAGFDSLYGGSGDDILIYDGDDAVINGGSGVDFLLSTDSSLNLAELLAGSEDGPVVEDVEVLVTGDAAASLTSLGSLEEYGVSVATDEDGNATLTLDASVWSAMEDGSFVTESGLTLQTTMTLDSDASDAQQYIFQAQASAG